MGDISPCRRHVADMSPTLPAKSESGRPPLGRKRTVEKGDNRPFQKKRRGNDLNQIHDPKSDLEDFDYDPEYDEGRFDDDCDERYTETRLQCEDYERNMDESERILTDQHRKEFMARDFPATLPLGDDAPHKTKVATIKMCRSKADFDKIINIVDNWHPELKIRDMEKGPERDNLLRFRKQFPAGNKLHFQYSVSTVHLPGCSPRKVLRKLELHKASGQLRPGRIVVSKEEVFDCIHDWHKFSQHLGQERSWRATRAKYYNISQELIRHYCRTCLACLKRNDPAKVTKGS